MKARLTFNLEEPGDVLAHNRCIKSTDMAILLFQLIYNTDIDELTNDKFAEMIEEAGIVIDDLIR